MAGYSSGTVSWSILMIKEKAEEALRESEDKLRQIIETVPSLLWSLGPNGEQTQLNQRALNYIGVRYEELLQLGFGPNSSIRMTFQKLQKPSLTPFRPETSYQAVHRLRRADGEYRWHHARGEPLRDRHGRVIQWYGLTVARRRRQAGREPAAAPQ